MSIRSRPYASVNRYPVRGPTFIPRAPVGGVAGGSNIRSLITGLAAPLLCLGCLCAIAFLGLFGTMIGAAVYMDKIQQQIRKNAQGVGTTIESNIVVLFCALLCSIYVLTKHRRGAAIRS